MPNHRIKADGQSWRFSRCLCDPLGCKNREKPVNADKATKAPGWEYRLTADLILHGLADIKRGYRDLPLTRMRASVCLSAEQSAQFVHEKLDELANWISYVKEVLDKDINASWGPEGVSGNRRAIEDACRKFLAAYSALLSWEQSFAKVIPELNWRPAFERFLLSTYEYLESAEAFFHDFQKLVADPNASGRKTLTLTFDFPKKLRGIEKDMKRALKASMPKQAKESNWDDLILRVLKSFIS